jgi:hypothetical protein
VFKQAIVQGRGAGPLAVPAGSALADACIDGTDVSI